MKTVSYLRCAHECVEESLRLVNKKEYLLSWLAAPKARAFYLVDAISRIAHLAIDCASLLYQAIRHLYTWGNEQSAWIGALQKADQTLSRMILSFFGAIFSPTLAYTYRETRFSEVAIAFLCCAFPDKLYYNVSGTGFKPAWTFTLPGKHLPLIR